MIIYKIYIGIVVVVQYYKYLKKRNFLNIDFFKGV